MKDIPVIEPKEIITTITNMKTGEVYKDDADWKAKGIPESDIRKDVRVIMPSLDLFGETIALVFTCSIPFETASVWLSCSCMSRA